jgi:hypothetical protein
MTTFLQPRDGTVRHVARHGSGLDPDSAKPGSPPPPTPASDKVFLNTVNGSPVYVKRIRNDDLLDSHVMEKG